MLKQVLSVIVLLVTFSVIPSSFAQDTESATESAQPPDNSAALEALIRLTRDQDATVRMTAFNSIAKIGEETPAVIAAVKSGLNDDDLRVRVESFYALNSAVQDGKAKVDALLLLIQDEDEQLALKAAEQLGKLGESAVPHLVKALENENARTLIVRTLGSLGGNARSAIPALTELLKTDDANLRALVATCLGQICRPPQQRSTATYFPGSRNAPRGPSVESVMRLVEAVWPRYDKDGDGKLSPEEQTPVRSMDETADTDGDKHVSREEFAEWYRNKISSRYRSGDRRSPAPEEFRRAFGGRPTP